MIQKAPGKAHRKGLTLLELTRMFPDDAAAEKWFIRVRWPNGIHCPECGSTAIVEKANRKPLPFRCKDCRQHFSVKTGSLMQGSKLGLQTWLFAIYLLTTSLKGQSSMKLRRDLGVTQKTAWFLAHRIRENFADQQQPSPFPGPVEVDEVYIGGKRKNMSNRKRKELAGTGRGAVGKAAVVGAKDRATNRVKARVVEKTDKPTLQGFVATAAAPGATVYTDDAAAYEGIPNPHEAVKHSVSEYVRGMAHTNGMESFWSMLKRGYQGIYHHMSEQHLDRYVSEFAGRHNSREQDTPVQMEGVVRRMIGKRLRYKDLIG